MTSSQELYERQSELLHKYRATTKVLQHSNMHLKRAIRDAESWNRSVLGLVETLQVLDSATAITSVFGIKEVPH